MDRVDRHRQIVIGDKDRLDLHKEFEDMFIAADIETDGSMYSGDNIKRRFPKVWELYRLVCL
jgi:hypothetical protein